MDNIIIKFWIFLILNGLSVDYVLSIVGGRDPKPEEARYQIILQWKQVRRFKSICGGGIIGEKYILTAAHCVFNGAEKQFFPGLMRIIAGTRDALAFDESTAIVKSVKRIMIPANYVEVTRDHVSLNDIAVLELKENLNLNEEITVISLKTKRANKIKRLKNLELPNGNNEPNDFQAVKLFGAGTGIDGVDKKVDKNTGKVHYFPDRSGKMKVATARRVDDQKCKNQWKSTAHQVLRPTVDHICAKVSEKTHRPGTRGFCQGDSGSPLVYNKKVVLGVLSIAYSPSCDTDRRAAIFTKVSRQTTFINNAMKYDNLETKQQEKIKVHVLP